MISYLKGLVSEYSVFHIFYIRGQNKIIEMLDFSIIQKYSNYFDKNYPRSSMRI